jgi:hypothetical protein
MKNWRRICHVNHPSYQQPFRASCVRASLECPRHQFRFNMVSNKLIVFPFHDELIDPVGCGLQPLPSKPRRYEPHPYAPLAGPVLQLNMDG